jgi:hypothetical protein
MGHSAIHQAILKSLFAVLHFQTAPVSAVDEQHTQGAGDF